MPDKHRIRQGDCLFNIASDRGFLWQTIWNHPENVALRSLRRDPNILKPGDLLYIPDRTVKQEPRSTDRKHVFVDQGARAVLRLRIVDYEYQTQPEPPAPPSPAEPARHVTEEDPELQPVQVNELPRANTQYALNIDGNLIFGTTDGEGALSQPIPMNARAGTLTMDPGTLQETVIPLKLGYLNPLSEISGLKHRLSNLGFGCGDDSDEITPDFQGSLREFQRRYSLPVTGEPDDATQSKLQQLHRS